MVGSSSVTRRDVRRKAGHRPLPAAELPSAVGQLIRSEFNCGAAPHKGQQ